MPTIIEQNVTEIDGWQQTVAGEREVPKALRKTLPTTRSAHLSPSAHGVEEGGDEQAILRMKH